MDQTQIELAIEKKFDDWIEHIKDEEVRELVKKNTVITGGCIASMLLDEEVNDFDVYMKTEEAAYKLARYYTDQVRSKEIYPIPEGDRISINLPNGRGLKRKKPKKKYSISFISSLAITLTNKIQITVRFYGLPDDIHKHYDFVHCTNYWTSWDRKLVIRPQAQGAIKKKQLVYIGSKYPIASIVRTKKFAKRGWKINAGQLVKMSMQVSELDLGDPGELKEQLVGMYAEDLTKVVEDTEVGKDGRVVKESLARAIDKHFKVNI